MDQNVLAAEVQQEFLRVLKATKSLHFEPKKKTNEGAHSAPPDQTSACHATVPIHGTCYLCQEANNCLPAPCHIFLDLCPYFSYQYKCRSVKGAF